MKNKMAEVAKLLGVELGEEFSLKNSNFRYKLTTYGLRKRHLTVKEWGNSCMLDDLLLGRVEIVKAVKPILDNIEKKKKKKKKKKLFIQCYQTFKDRIDYIAKVNLANRREYILIKMKNYEND